MGTHRSAIVVIALTLWLPALDAVAQDQNPATATEDSEARMRFELGREAYGQARYEDALDEFERAYRLSPRPALLYNMGQCLDRLRRDGEAIEIFERYLRELPQAANRVEVETRLGVLRETQRARGPSAARGALEVAQPRDGGDDGGLTSRWWFWTAVGGALLAGAIVTVAVVSSGDPGAEAPFAGDVGTGGVVFALGAP